MLPGSRSHIAHIRKDSHTCTICRIHFITKSSSCSRRFGIACFLSPICTCVPIQNLKGGGVALPRGPSIKYGQPLAGTAVYENRSCRTGGFFQPHFLSFSLQFAIFSGMKQILLPFYSLFCYMMQVLMLQMPILLSEIGAGRAPLCGLNTASPLRAKAVFKARSRNSGLSFCRIRICFRETKSAAIVLRRA